MVSNEKKERVFEAFRICLSKEVAFTVARLSREERMEILADEDFIREMDAIRAEGAMKDINILDNLISSMDGVNDTKSAPILLKALEQRRDLLFQSFGASASEEKCLNIQFIKVSKEDMENNDRVEMHPEDDKDENKNKAKKVRSAEN